MPINPNIALNVQPPAAPNPLDSLAKVLQIKNVIAQQPLIQQQLQTGQLENQQRQMQLKQTQDLNDAYKSSLTVNPDGTTDIDSGQLTKALATAGSGAAIPAVLKGVNDFKKSAVDLAKANGEVDLQRRNVGGSIAAAVEPLLNDPLHAANMVLTLGAHAVANKTMDPEVFAPIQQSLAQSLQQDPTGASAAPILKNLVTTLKQNSPEQQKLQNEETTAAARKSQADVAEREFNLKKPKLTAEAEQAQVTQASQALGAAKTQRDWDATYQKLSPELQQRFGPQFSPEAAQRATELGLTPEQRVTAIREGGLITATPAELDGVLKQVTAANPTAYAQFAPQLAFYANKGDQAGARKVISEASAQVGAINKETNPRVLAARTQQAVQTAKALREGDNPALAGVPPAAVSAATSAATKLDLEYAKAKAAADSIETVLNLAGAGNKAAGANAPLVGVGAVNAVNAIKRINSAEIAQYGTAGSLLDKIQGKLQGWTEGQPIPKDVLADMRALHTALRQSSYQQYTDGLNSINTRYGSKFGPTAPNPAAAASVPQNLKSQFPNDVWARDPQGQLHHAPKGQALPQGWNAVN